MNDSPLHDPSSDPEAGAVQVAARQVPPPGSLSPAAQAYLRRGAVQAPPLPVPDVRDVAGWRAHVREGERALPVDLLMGLPGVEVETRQIGTAICHVAVPTVSDTDRRRVNLFLHGGGWVLFGGRAAMALAKVTAMQYGGITYAVDYRMPPDHRFPAGLDDCLAVYREVIARHGADNVLVSGSSAGGNLAAALMLRARDEGLPPPCALFLDSPVTDLTNAGDSWAVLEGFDPILRDPGVGVGSVALYLDGQDPRHPYLSPLFGQLSDAFPPTYLRTGTRDRLLSDTVRLHAALRAAGVPADLFVAEAMPHAGFGGTTPEDAAALEDTRRWLATRWPRGAA